MDVKKYLKRISIDSDVKPDLETLRLLHRHHLYNIPFENLDIHSGRKIILEKDKLLKKIVDEGRGGFCYELNGTFYELLSELGFSVKMVAAGVYENNGKYSPEFDHMALIVNINNVEYLADVGFGDSFIEPLKFKSDEIQKDVTDFYRISKTNDGGHYILSRSSSPDEQNFAPQYKFSLTPRVLKQFNTMCEYNQTSPQSHFTQKIICSRATESGRISLSDLKLIVTENGFKKQREISEDEFYSLLKEHFNIKLGTKLVFPNRTGSSKHIIK